MEKKKIEIKSIIIAVFCLFVVVYAIINAKFVFEPVKNLIGGDISFDEMVVQIQDNYKSDDLVWKEKFINVNGLFARVIGRQECNDVILTQNGMLTSTVNKSDMEIMGVGISEFSSYLTEHDIEFTFVMAPHKEDLNDEILPLGVESYANENADSLIEYLEENNVDVLDLRPYLVGTPEQTKEYFFDTDHHWNGQGSFLGYQKLTEYIYEKFPEANIDMSYADLKQWEAHTLENWFLGSRGRRVGQFFCGVDDFTYYTPLFETDMSCAVPVKTKFYFGDFSTAIIRGFQVEERDYFNCNPYAVYFGQDLGLVHHRNLNAPSDLNILLIKDSFGLPIEAYMSTMYQEIDVIDPRFFNEGSVAEYVQRTNPDMVIMLINANNTQEYYYELGIDSVVTEREYISVIDREDVYIEAAENNFNYKGVTVESGQTYKLEIGNIELSDASSGATVVLYNASTKKTISARIIDVDYYRQNDGFEWIFDTPDVEGEELELLLYAGINGQTQNIEATYKDFCLSVSK